MMFTSPRSYLYGHSLGRQHVRLLKLRPGTEGSQDLDCELFEASFDGAPPYEAVSWTWGGEEPNKILRIHDSVRAHEFPIQANLHSALRALRSSTDVRVLWIDAICIDQNSNDEKNLQVPMMADIYGKATSVCIWLGDHYEESKLAMDFIKDDVLQLWEFDRLCENQNRAPQWKALIRLMMRPWFSRRWVVQEIALARRGILYCGRDHISWNDFADAVSLFVEVESATHRLSEVMKKDQTLGHIPDFFGHVPALGATLLVNATSNLFRPSKEGQKERLSSLEYLVSSMPAFKAKIPHDIIYALLAISKDTVPRAPSQEDESFIPGFKELSAWGQKVASKKYPVNYEQPFIEVCKEFVAFSISQSEESRALDIICRPWAPQIDDETPQSLIDVQRASVPTEGVLRKLPSWIPDLRGAAFGMHDAAVGKKMGRLNADPLVGLPVSGHRNYSAAGKKMVNRDELRFRKRPDHYSMFVEGFILHRIVEVEEVARSGNIPETWLKFGGWKSIDEEPPQEFWRTVVADRGPNGRNPPPFYPRASRESIKKGMHGGALESKSLIDDGRCSIIAEFLRRVQGVIWNRRLMRAQPLDSEEGPGRLGLVPYSARVGDLVCILYGCTVPVILRKSPPKSNQEIADEMKADEHARMVEAALTIQRGYRNIRKRRLKRDELREQLRLRGGRNLPNASSTSKFYHWRNYPDLAKEQYHHLRAVLRWCHARLKFAVRRLKGPAKLVMNVYLHFTGYNGPIYIGAYAILYRNTDAYFLLLAIILTALLANAILPRVLSELWFLVPKIWSRRIVIKEPPRHYYELVGECYLHGMMDGEAIKYQNEDGIKRETFEIR